MFHSLLFNLFCFLLVCFFSPGGGLVHLGSLLERNADLHFALRNWKTSHGSWHSTPMSGIDPVPIETTQSDHYVEDWPQEEESCWSQSLISYSRSRGLKACFSKLGKKMKLELAQLYAVLGQWRWEASGAFWGGGCGANGERLDQSQPHQLMQQRCILHYVCRYAPELDSFQGGFWELISIAKLLTLPRCPSACKQIKKMCPCSDFWVLGPQMLAPTSGLHFKKEILTSVTIWINPEGIMLSEISYTQEETHCITAVICGS